MREQWIHLVLDKLTTIESNMVTKDDIANMATKDDIANMATKDDIAHLSAEISKLSAKMDAAYEQIALNTEYITAVREFAAGLSGIRP